MKTGWVVLLVLAAMGFWARGAENIKITEADTFVRDVSSVRKSDPIEVWRKMRPQDFVGAPTVWQVIV